MSIEINKDFTQVLEALQRGENIFLTGKAGTGKSTFLRYFLETSEKNIVVLAPTGVAALNVEGQTIHSFYGIFPVNTERDIPEILGRNGHVLYDILSETDLLVIDEISMVRADLLDMIEKITREVFSKSKRKQDRERASLPFAGIQLLFIGDLYQLPPVLKSTEKESFSTMYDSPYFFSAKCYPSLAMKIYELEKIYRQNDKVFIDILNRIRNGTVTEEDIAILNERCDPDFEPGEKQYIYLTTHNDIVDEINQRELQKLPSSEKTYQGKIQGEFSEKDMPTDYELVLKKGAQVMFLTNEPSGAWVNGTIGRVLHCGRDVVEVELDDGTEVEVHPYTWTSYRYETVGKNEVKKTPTGSFTQFPLRLAWSITVHKSQGKTFSHVILDMKKGAFASGQTYVALSRVTSLEGLVLKHPIRKSHVKVDSHIIHFMTGARYQQAEEASPLEEKRSLLQKAIDEKKLLEMVYLKPDDTKSRRVILPLFVGTMEYHGKTFEGLRAFCHLSGEERTFRLDRILEIHELSSQEKKI